MKTLATDYIGKADTSVDTIMLENGHVAYLYNKNGDTSLLANLTDLIAFLNGNISARMGTFPTEHAEEMIEGFEKIFAE